MVKVVVPIVPSRSVRAVINPVPATMRKAVRVAIHPVAPMEVTGSVAQAATVSNTREATASSAKVVINPVPATMRKAVREVTASSVLAITTVPEMATRRTTTSIVAVTASSVLAGNLVPATIPMRNTA